MASWFPLWRPVTRTVLGAEVGGGGGWVGGRRAADGSWRAGATAGREGAPDAVIGATGVGRAAKGPTGGANIPARNQS